MYTRDTEHRGHKRQGGYGENRGQKGHGEHKGHRGTRDMGDKRDTEEEEESYVPTPPQVSWRNIQ